MIRFNTKSRLYWSIFLILISLFTISFFKQSNSNKIDDDRFITYVVNPKKAKIQFYWKDENGNNFKNVEKLITWLKKKNKKLLFGMNAGMYKKDNTPQGLYIENSIIKNKIDTLNGDGNFYLKPNGIFYITTNLKPVICKTNDFKWNENINFATQSGPMLVIDGEIHKSFKENSQNINIRNGVGILPNNEVLFVMSKKEINFYDFANYFKVMGCKNALYLDGYVSRTYLPQKKWIQTDGNFGVIIGITK